MKILTMKNARTPSCSYQRNLTESNENKSILLINICTSRKQNIVPIKVIVNRHHPNKAIWFDSF